jgi:lipid A ethanolaminephosphotransferase
MAESTASGATPGRSGWNPLALALFGGLWVAAFGNWPLWLALSRLPELTSASGMVFIAAFGLMVAALMTGLLAITAWRRTIKTAVGVLALSAALGAYFMGTYGVVLDPTMMLSVLQTDPQEVRDLLSPQFVANLLLLAVVPVALLWRVPVKQLRTASQAWRNMLGLFACMALIAALILAFFAEMSGTMRNHRSLRYLINPVNSYSSLGVIASQANARPSGPPQPIGADARVGPRPTGSRPPLLVLVIGETARADHFSLNGYTRPTNPELATRNVVSFRDVTACGTNTAASLPCMFSALGRTAFESRPHDQENLLDLVQRAGLAVLWLDNQSGCKGLCDRVPHAAAIDAVPGLPAPPASLCAEAECQDEALLFNLDARLSALPADRRERGVLVVLHQMGSHGPAYFKRSPPGRKPFAPECATAVLQQCPAGSVINAYDNSIAYTDHVLAKVIDWLNRQASSHDPALLYVSDHGESLGENNIYLHGLPYALAPREQTHVPMIAWLGGALPEESDARMACLKERRDLPLSHDNLFHVVVGLLGIEAGEYRKSLDVLAACKGQ